MDASQFGGGVKSVQRVMLDVYTSSVSFATGETYKDLVFPLATALANVNKAAVSFPLVAAMSATYPDGNNQSPATGSISIIVNSNSIVLRLNRAAGFSGITSGVFRWANLFKAGSFYADPVFQNLVTCQVVEYY